MAHLFGALCASVGLFIGHKIALAWDKWEKANVGDGV
jgi:hypothetical protein